MGLMRLMRLGLRGKAQMKTVGMLALLVLGLMLFAAACGGDDDDSTSASDASGSQASSDAAPTDVPSGDDDEGEEASSDDSSGSDAGVGTVTIGDETWTVIPSGQCEATDEGGIPVFSIAGHADGDEVLEIVIDFDPRDTGLQMTVMGGASDPGWTAIDADFVVSAGGTHISGEGNFEDPTGNTAEGSFDVRC
jgi:hypothetical protein